MPKFTSIVLLAVLFSAPGTAQRGSEPGKQRATCTADTSTSNLAAGLRTRKKTPSAGTFSRVSTDSATHPIKTDFYNPGDTLSLVNNFLRSEDADTGSSKIRFNTLLQNLVVSNRPNGPGQASVGLGITSIKPDFRTSESTQEVDGLYIQTKTGLHGDTSAILADASGVDGGDSFINILEGTASSVASSTGLQNKVIRYQAGLIDLKNAVSAGTNIVSQKGIVDYGILIQSESLSNRFSNFIYANTAKVKKWAVDGEGNEYLAGSSTVHTVNTSHLNLTEISANDVQTPLAGTQTVFIDVTDHRLKRKDSSGTIITIG